MAVNKTAEPWPDERLSDLDHDSWIIKLINPDYFSLGDHFFGPRTWTSQSIYWIIVARINCLQCLWSGWEQVVFGSRLMVFEAYLIRSLFSYCSCSMIFFFSNPARTDIIGPLSISKQGGGRERKRTGLRRGARADQWANKTNRWDETTEKSEVINLQRQDDPTNHMHWLEMRSVENLWGVSY